MTKLQRLSTGLFMGLVSIAFLYLSFVSIAHAKEPAQYSDVRIYNRTAQDKNWGHEAKFYYDAAGKPHVFFGRKGQKEYEIGQDDVTVVYKHAQEDGANSRSVVEFKNGQIREYAIQRIGIAETGSKDIRWAWVVAEEPPYQYDAATGQLRLKLFTEGERIEGKSGAKGADLYSYAVKEINLPANGQVIYDAGQGKQDIRDVRRYCEGEEGEFRQQELQRDVSVRWGRIVPGAPASSAGETGKFDFKQYCEQFKGKISRTISRNQYVGTEATVGRVVQVVTPVNPQNPPASKPKDPPAPVTAPAPLPKPVAVVPPLPPVVSPTDLKDVKIDNCEDEVALKLAELIRKDHKKVLALQLRLTTLKLALETIEGGYQSAEQYVRREEKGIDKLDPQGQIRSELREHYKSFQADIDRETLRRKFQKNNYVKKTMRFTNLELSAYTGAHRAAYGTKSPYDDNDTAILWMQDYVSTEIERQTHRGSAKGNLSQVSTLVAHMSGILGANTRKDPEAVRGEIEKVQAQIAQEFDAMAGTLGGTVEACQATAGCTVDDETRNRALTLAVGDLIKTLQKENDADRDALLAELTKTKIESPFRKPAAQNVQPEEPVAPTPPPVPAPSSSVDDEDRDGDGSD